jgi:phosphomannomutase
MRKNKTAVDVGSDQCERLELTNEIVQIYRLDKWAQEFSLMTAGYRDRLDPEDAANPEVPFNVVSVALLAEAKARVFERQLAPGQTGHVHVGGETRPHTQTFIRVAARVYAAHGFQVHLRKTLLTTPIWYSSFGTFYTECQSGDNLTASHSQYFKGGWKPVDGWGQQLLKEEPGIQAELKTIVEKRQTIKLSTYPSPLIVKDFDVDDAYVAFQRLVVGDALIAELAAAGREGLRTAVCTMGGSMKATSERLFKALGISTGSGGVVDYYYGEEDSRYHNIGEVNGEDIGVDPSKPAIYRKLKAQEKLLSGEADIVLLWDPDGDRLNVVTKALISDKDAAVAAGLEVDEEYIRPNSKECIVYFTPNQLYLMLTAFRITKLKEEGELSDRDWFIGITFPTSQSFAELAAVEGLRCVRVPVGFKYLGSLCRAIEEQLDQGEVVFETAIGDRVSLGKKPRALILAEESGGATLGSCELLRSRSGARSMLALREKDAMQLGLLSLCLAATLHKPRVSFARHYCDLLAQKGITFIHYSRSDVPLYDESRMGAELRAAKQEGFRKRDQVMEFFGRLADEHKTGGLSLEGVRDEINRRTPADKAKLPPLQRVCRAGDDLLLHGVIFETIDLRIIVRASGTDALLRYYVEGTDRETVLAVQETLKAFNAT